MSSKSDAARNAIGAAAAGGMFRAKPVEQAAEVVPANIVEIKPDAAGASAAEKVPAANASTVRATAKRVMLYLPPKAKMKFKEMAFYEERKEHDLYVEALREYLESKGHKGLL